MPKHSFTIVSICLPNRTAFTGYVFCSLQSILSVCLISLLLAIREKFLTEIQSPRYARLRDWHHDRSARALNIKS